MCSTRADIDGKASALKEPPLHNRSFEKLLLDAVDEALSSLGASSKLAVYHHLEKKFDISRQDIPYKIEEFANAIEKIFGLGAKYLEIQIMKRVYEKIGPVLKYFPEGELAFTDYVAAARSSLRTHGS